MPLVSTSLALALLAAPAAPAPADRGPASDASTDKLTDKSTDKSIDKSTDEFVSAPGCRGPLTAEVAVRCALAASPAVRAAEAAVEAAQGRRDAASTLLPSNPHVEVTVAARRGMWNGERDVNVYGRLAQELELGGQRGKRRRVAEADHTAQRRRVDAVRREVAAEVLRVHVEALAAREQRTMALRMTTAADTLVALAREGEKAGLASALMQDLAAVTVVRLRQQQIEAERRISAAHAVLAGLLGQDPARPDLEAAGALGPLAVPEDISALVSGALVARAELDVARAEREQHLRQVELYKRLRAPNPSVLLYAQRDGFNERVLGGGLSFPIPLPSPLGRAYRGEIASSKALARQAEAELERLRRSVRAEVVVAAEALRARRAELALFDPERITRAEGHVTALSEEMAAGRLSIREAAVLQQTFLELLAAHLEARRALALAAVELARVAGLLPMEGAP